MSTLKVIGILFSLGLLDRLNKWLSRMALNGYTKDPTWNWKKEVIVVTGGSSGIGAKLALKLSGAGLTVIILDVNSLSRMMGIYNSSTSLRMARKF